MIEVLTGFKYIAEIVRLNEGKREFIGGGEESYGFNVGEYVRDKDAVIACCMFAEMAAWAAEHGKSVYDLLEELYVKFGYYRESLLSLTKRGKEGVEAIKIIMKNLREKPLQNLDGSPVVLAKDYKSGECIDTVSDLRHKINLPSSDVLQFVSQDNTVVSVRPSGTEPKIKFYFGVKTTVKDKSELAEAERQMLEKLARLSSDFSKL
jgi:phosphoglucomutase